MSTTISTKRVPRKGKAALAVAALAVATGALALSLGAAAPADGAFSGSNGKIAYASYDSTSYDIWLMNADGSSRTSLTSSTDHEDSPAFSPDGSKIAYVRGELTDLDDVWIMNADGTGQTNLTPSPGQDGAPVWSPDGNKIAFASARDGDWEIYVMNADGSGQRNLTRHPGNDTEPSWSPDSSEIAFESSRDGNSEVFAMNADGSDQTNLTRSPGRDLDPGLVDRREQDRVRALRLRHPERPPGLRDEPGRLRADEPEPQRGPRLGPVLVAGRQQDRVLELPRGQRRDLRDERGRDRPAQRHPARGRGLRAGLADRAVGRSRRRIRPKGGSAGHGSPPTTVMYAGPTVVAP